MSIILNTVSLSWSHVPLSVDLLSSVQPSRTRSLFIFFFSVKGLGRQWISRTLRTSLPLGTPMNMTLCWNLYVTNILAYSWRHYMTIPFLMRAGTPHLRLPRAAWREIPACCHNVSPKKGHAQLQTLSGLHTMYRSSRYAKSLSPSLKPAETAAEAGCWPKQKSKGINPTPCSPPSPCGMM